MTRQSVFRFLAALALLLFLLTMNSHARYRDSRRMQNEQSYILWYDRPASKWVEALALGNGRIGAMVHGGISEDRVCLNDNTLYSGEPGQRDLPLDITKDFDRVVGWLRAGKYAAAEKFATQHWGGRAQPYYQPLGDLNLQFPVERSIPFVFEDCIDNRVRNPMKALSMSLRRRLPWIIGGILVMPLAASIAHGPVQSSGPIGGEPPATRSVRVASLPELEAKIATANPGDLILVKNGVYTTTGPIKVNKQGASGRPIVIAAETVGGVEIKGIGGFDLVSPAAYVTIRGFKFTHAVGTVQVRAGTNHCRLTRNVFELTGEGRYLLVSGDDAEIDHNTFQNKKTGGPMFSIHGPGRIGMAQRTHVHHNLFQDYTSIGRNGGETLQVGLSGKSLTDAHSIIEHNLFLRCNGENEAISNKSCANIYRYNTFRDMVGELTLRHGNRCEVYGNYFFNTHGLRFFGDDHKIYSNYFEGCDPALQIGNGGTKIPPGELTGHDQPERVRFMFNTFVDNKRNVIMGGRTNGLGAVDLIFANNLLQSDSGTMLQLAGPLSSPKFEGNIVWGIAMNGDLPASGSRRVNPGLVKGEAGVFRLSAASPAIDAATGFYEEVTSDIDGQARSGKKDVGADEFSRGRATYCPLTVTDVGPNVP